MDPGPGKLRGGNCSVSKCAPSHVTNPCHRQDKVGVGVEVRAVHLGQLAKRKMALDGEVMINRKGTSQCHLSSKTLPVCLSQSFYCFDKTPQPKTQSWGRERVYIWLILPDHNPSLEKDLCPMAYSACLLTEPRTTSVGRHCTQWDEPSPISH